MRNSFANVKCPVSCTTINMESASRTCRNLLINTIVRDSLAGSGGSFVIGGEYVVE